MGDRQMDRNGPTADAQGYQGTPPPGAGAHGPAREQSPYAVPPGYGQHGAPAPAPKKANPKLRKRLIIAGSIVAGLLVLLVVGGFFGYKQLSEKYNPKLQVEDYLQAVVDGDIEGAMDMVTAYDEMGYYQAQDYSLMTNEIYSKAANRISGFEITDVEASGIFAEVTADVKQGDKTTSVTFDLTSAGDAALFFEKWELTSPLNETEIAYRVDAGASELAVNGVGIDTFEESKYFAVFPGDYTFNTPTGSDYIGYSGEEKVSVEVRTGDEIGEPVDVTYRAELTDAAREEIKAQTKAHLAACVKATELQPQGCPNKADGEDPKNFRNIKWSMTKEPTYESIEGSPASPFPLTAKNGQFTLEAEEKQGDSWGPIKGTVELYSMPAMVDVQPDKINIAFGD
ncbi:hypothetical protein GD627_01170 [Arthrobacter yangruifuii]|uniref:DUF4878 domain-containing protein n=1 Tax=Arthrobacter yangruifuii TaxID=2606616 RepID=A0A5N6MSK2_9MICC|nr:hypothetical protein [Arthrobacter yangruifuii]KAD4059740.1 hypothetical protein GD627_01170 [Arthrobacter yangruifuii]